MFESVILYSFLILITFILGLRATAHQGDAFFVLRFGKGTFGRIDLSYILYMIPIILILSFVSAVRDGVGIDYDAYVFFIDRIQDGIKTHMEFGFVQISLLLSKINQNPRLVIIVFGILTIIIFAKSIWDQSVNIGYSFFVFLTWGYYFVTFNTIRNYFALALIIYGIKYLNDGKLKRFVALCLVAATIHKSALICIPLYLLARKKIVKTTYIIYIFACILFLVLKKYMRMVVFWIYPSYLGSEYDIGRISYLNIIKAVGVIIICLFCFNAIKNNKLYTIYFNLNVFSLLLYIGLYWLPEVSRIGFYLNTIDIFLVPVALMEAKKRGNNKIMVPIVMLMSIFLFGMLCVEFSAPSSGVLPYKTWLF